MCVGGDVIVQQIGKDSLLFLNKFLVAFLLFY